MIKTAPSLGDFVVEYRDLSRGRGAARVVIVHLTDDAGPEEVFSSCLARTGMEAERLAATWALEDGTCAWRALRADDGDAALTRIGTDVASVPTTTLRPSSVQSGIIPAPMHRMALPADKRWPGGGGEAAPSLAASPVRPRGRDAQDGTAGGRLCR